MCIRYIRRTIARANVKTGERATKNVRWFGTRNCVNASATNLRKSVRADLNGSLLFAGKQEKQI